MSLTSGQRQTLKLDQKFITPFLHAVRAVFSTMVQLDVSAQRPQALRSKFSPGDVYAWMPMSCSEIQGQLIISFPEKTLLKVASKMIMEEFSSLEPIVKDSAGELCNIVTGSAKVELSEHGYNFDMAQPSVFTQAEIARRSPAGLPRIVVPYETSFGNFFVDIGFESSHA